MDKNNAFPALKLRKSSEIRSEGKSDALTSQQEKQRLLDGMASGEHLITLLGAACRYIGELTDDPKFYREAKRCVRCRGIAENHIPSKIERWEQLQEEIERTNGNYHLETDSTCKQLFHTMTMSLCRHAEELERQLRAEGMTWTKEEGWHDGNGGRV
ncbi:hypothetical protein [Butyricicoccus intestinisimiae]|uniref:Uncharacterized protein n=1 Tax=Butyricicoccus intestinisimiae TaxID=2841509 RepID=A0ABS6ERG1_9FIRM|nr:hypothetical protein [Butyricicoccus intestinisimiae]MBU5489802.1 hypothetical protein [Butyricicoccus intestinisimiae]